MCSLASPPSSSPAGYGPPYPGYRPPSLRIHPSGHTLIVMFDMNGKSLIAEDWQCLPDHYDDGGRQRPRSLIY